MLRYKDMLLYGDTPRAIYERYEEKIRKSKIWRDFDKIFDISQKKKLNTEDIDYLAELYPSLKETLQIKKLSESTKNYREFAIRNYLLEKPALLEYVFPEILLCFAEIIIFPKGVGGRPDIILAQESHRTIPRHYLIIELKAPTSYTKRKEDSRSISTSIVDALAEQSLRILYGLNNSKLFRDLFQNENIKGIWVDTAIIAGLQVFHGNQQAIPIGGFEEPINKIKSYEKSDVVLGLKKMLAPLTLLSYDSILRPMMRDIIALGGEVFDKWIEKKSIWIISRTMESTRKEFNSFKQYNPYVL